MRTFKKIQVKVVAVLFLALLVNSAFASGAGIFKKDKNQENEGYVSYSGKVVDADSQKPLIFASISITGTNIATVTNTEGKFTIKIPNEKLNSEIKVSYMGYKNFNKPISDLKKDKNNTLKMEIVSVNLTEVSVFPNNPRMLIDKVMSERLKNYQNEPVLMTAFYRETVQKRRSYVGLSEAVVEVYKQPYNSFRSDAVRFYKGRQSREVKKMDTLLFKLQGGPHSTLMLDIIKDPYMILSDDVLDSYEYTYVNITKVDGQLNYVIEFKQRSYISMPLFYGKFYINVDNFAISSAYFSLNTENRSEASAMFIKKKPFGVTVYPTSANYFVKYIEKDGRWYYNYARGEVNFKVKWKKRLFNTSFTTMVEMAVTDWESVDSKPFKPSDRIKMNVIMNDAVNGFTDKDFWGELNTIEPEKSIESAIKKISKNLNK